jgi:hypothetical protein
MVACPEENARLHDLLNITDSDISVSENPPVLNSHFIKIVHNRMKTAMDCRPISKLAILTSMHICH